MHMQETDNVVLSNHHLLFFLPAIESVFATLPNAQRGVPLIINGDPKGKNILYCNGHSVIIRDIDVGWPWSHSMPVIAVAVSRLGTRLCIYPGSHSPKFKGNQSV